MQSRFQQMSDSIITRIDEMGERIDDLEKSVGDLVQQAEDDVNAPAPEGAVTPAK
jgi:heat shock factor-binding protein 1